MTNENKFNLDKFHENVKEIQPILSKVSDDIKAHWNEFEFNNWSAEEVRRLLSVILRAQEINRSMEQKGKTQDSQRFDDFWEANSLKDKI